MRIPVPIQTDSQCRRLPAALQLAVLVLHRRVQGGLHAQCRCADHEALSTHIHLQGEKECQGMDAMIEWFLPALQPLIGLRQWSPTCRFRSAYRLKNTEYGLCDWSRYSPGLQIFIRAQLFKMFNLDQNDPKLKIQGFPIQNQANPSYFYVSFSKQHRIESP